MKRQKKIYFKWEHFDEAVKDLARQIKRSKVQYKDIYGIPRGGLSLASALAYRLELPITFSPGSKTLICDDINDTGETLKHYIEQNIAVIHSKERSRVKEQFSYIKVQDDDWIVYPWETLSTSKLDRAK